MSIYDRLAQISQPAALHDEVTSYYSEPEDRLDPKLFSGDTVRPHIRTGVLATLYGFWNHEYRDPESWSTVHLAGSGVSYQWSAARDPGDLDCLISLDFVGFRRANPDFRDLGDGEIAHYLNRELQTELWPQTKDWHGYELTFYINGDRGDIRNIHPYAAYNLTDNRWTVHPDPSVHAPHSAVWDALAAQDLDLAEQIIRAYNLAYNDVQGTNNPGLRLNAEITLRTSAAKGAALFDAIHEGRKLAFGPDGGGYSDFNEFRYKTAKGHGILAALREMKQELRDAGLLNDEDVYGLDLPDAHDAIVQAAVSRYRQHR